VAVIGGSTAKVFFFLFYLDIRVTFLLRYFCKGSENSFLFAFFVREDYLI